MLSPVTGGKKVRFPFPFNKKRSLHFIANLVEQEKFKPLIDRVFAFDNVQEAYRYVMSGQKTGNVILSVHKA